MSREGETPRRYHTARARPYRNNSKPLIRRYGYKVQEVADGLNMPRGTLSDYVAGYRPFPRECLKKIASFIGCDVEEFKYLETASQPGARDERQLPSGGLIPGEPLLREPVKETRHLVPGTQRATNVLVLPFTSVQIMPPGLTAIDCACWFGMKQAQIITLITHWNGREMCYDELQAMLNQEIIMFDAMKPQCISEEYTISRRQALVAIAALPTALLAAFHQREPPAIVMAEFLSRCTASIVACWHLMRGSQFIAVGELLPKYLPQLVILAQQPSPNQRLAAGLTIQGYLLKGLLAFHRLNFSERETYSKEALRYTHVAADRNLEVAVLAYLAYTLYYNNKPQQALRRFQEILPSINEVSPLLQSHVYTGLAHASARCNQKQDALTYIIKAHEAFPQKPEEDPCFLFAEHSISQLYMHEGAMYLDLGENYPDEEYYRQAKNAFAHVNLKALHSTIFVPERVRIETMNYQARVAVELRQMEEARNFLIEGANGAKLLNSEKRRQEAIAVYNAALDVWPHESQIQELADLFIN